MRERKHLGFSRAPSTMLKRTQGSGLQRKSPGGTGRWKANPSSTTEVAPPLVHDVLSSPGQPLAPESRAMLEPRLGHDFSHVRVHTDSRAAQSARSVDALAYTVGRHIVFGEGQYSPGTAEGQRVLAHELAHVVQQRDVAANAPSRNSLRIGAAGDSLEREAHDMSRALHSQSMPQPSRAPGLSALRLQRYVKPLPGWGETIMGDDSNMEITSLKARIEWARPPGKPSEVALQGQKVLHYIKVPAGARFNLVLTTTVVVERDMNLFNETKVWTGEWIWEGVEVKDGEVTVGNRFGDELSPGVGDAPCFLDVIPTAAGGGFALTYKLIDSRSTSTEKSVGGSVQLPNPLNLVLSDSSKLEPIELSGSYTRGQSEGQKPLASPTLGFRILADKPKGPITPEQPKKEPPKDKPGSKKIVIYFDYGSGSISSNGRNELGRLLKPLSDLDPFGEVTRMRVDGYASPPGSQHYNKGLAERRVTAVMALIKDLWGNEKSEIGIKLARRVLGEDFEPEKSGPATFINHQPQAKKGVPSRQVVVVEILKSAASP